MTQAMHDHLPAEGLWLAYYGDDFTGSTDVLDAFTAAGVPTVLFLQPPRPQDLARFPGVRCVGVAGQSRGKSPAWMRETLPEVFERLSALGAPIVQYKVCSTFDSSPEVGSIGQAIDLGVQHTRAHWSPMVVGAPRLQRYQVFGHLLPRHRARSGALTATRPCRGTRLPPCMRAICARIWRSKLHAASDWSIWRK